MGSLKNGTSQRPVQLFWPNSDPLATAGISRRARGPCRWNGRTNQGPALPTRVTAASLQKSPPASSATSAFEDVSVHSDEAPAAIDPFSTRWPPGTFADGNPAVRPRCLIDSAGQMQRVPVYRLTFASSPCGRVRPGADELSVHPVAGEPDRHDPPAKPETVFWGADMPGRSGHWKGCDSRSETAATFLPSHRGDRCSTPMTERMRNLLATSAGPASPQRLAVYPRAERGNCAGDSRVIEKVAGGILEFFAGFLLSC